MDLTLLKEKEAEYIIDKAGRSWGALAPGSGTFEEGNKLEGLSYPDCRFGVVYRPLFLGQLLPPGLPLWVVAGI